MSTISIVISGIVLILCVVLIAYVHKREAEKAAMREKIAKYRFRANQATSILSNLAQLPIGVETRQALMQYALLHLTAINKLTPNDQTNNNNIQILKTQLESPQSPADNQRLIIPNDMQQLKRQISQFTNLAKFIVKIGKSPAISDQLAAASVQKIISLITESKICAYIQQGKEMLTKHDYVPAQRNFTLAQQMLANVKNKNSRLQQLETELLELIKSTPNQALDTELSLNEKAATEAEKPEEKDDLFGPKKKW